MVQKIVRFRIAPDSPIARRIDPSQISLFKLSTLRFVHESKEEKCPRFLKRELNFFIPIYLVFLSTDIFTLLYRSKGINAVWIILLLLFIKKAYSSRIKLPFIFFPNGKNKNVNIRGAVELIPGTRDCHVEQIKMIYMRRRTIKYWITRHYRRRHPTNNY